MKVCCLYSLESPHRGDSNKYTQHTIISIKRKSTEYIPNAIMSAAIGFLYKGLKNDFDIAVVNESSVFELLTFYCTCIHFLDARLSRTCMC